MVDAPERIWATYTAWDRRLVGISYGEVTGCPEYVRVDHITTLEAQLAELETENGHLRNDYGDLDARLHLVTLDRDRCAAKAEALSRTGAVKEALERLAVVAERQKAYHNAKQHEFPNIEQCVDDDGALRPAAKLYDLLQGEAANGRYSEADWWLCTIRAEIASLSALEPTAPERQQPVAEPVRVCPARDAICPHGTGCLYNDGMDCDIEASRADLAYQKQAASYTRPSEGQQPVAKRHPLEVYADSYAEMSRMGDGRVDCRSVEVDIRQNMIPATRSEQAVTKIELIRHLANVIRITDSGTYRDRAGARPSIHPEFEDAINALKAAMETER